MLSSSSDVYCTAIYACFLTCFSLCFCCSPGVIAKQTELGVLQRATEGLQQRLEEAERDKRQASELHSSNTSKV